MWKILIAIWLYKFSKNLCAICKTNHYIAAVKQNGKAIPGHFASIRRLLSNAGVFCSNINHLDDELEIALGEFARRLLECFSVFYWIELIPKAPMYMLRSMNETSDGVLSRAFVVVVTVTWNIFLIGITVFNEEFRTFVLNYAEKF